jgi:thiamine kinase-like enzyme
MVEVNITETQILQIWKEWGIEYTIPVKLKEPLQKHHLSVIKNTNTRFIMKIDAPSVNGTYPLIVKVNKGSPFSTRQKEWLLYKNLKDTKIKKFFPDIYEARLCNEDEVWTFMECLNVFENERNLTVDQLFRIVTRLAELHAATFEHQPVAEKISGVISGFQSEERTQKLGLMNDHIKQAMEDGFLNRMIGKYCPKLYDLAELDLDFPEVIASGRCLNHGDLHIGNICYDSDNSVKFIDFSGATFSPCWLDIVKLIEFMMDHHPEWGNQNQIRKKAIRVYIQTMKKKGVTFNHNCNRLYRMAYLMIVFENELRRHLKAVLNGETRYIFPKILKKISRFSKELQLLD